MTLTRSIRPIMPARTTWLVQRFEPGTGYVNPYGDMNQQISNKVAQKLIADLVTPDYMGAAEYEWGAYSDCLAKMFEHELLLEKYDGFRIPIYIVSGNMELAKEAIHKIYDETKVTVEKYNSYRRLHYSEISKNDYGSFKAVVDNNKANYYTKNTIGWMSLVGYYAWFIDEDVTKSFKRLLTPDEWRDVANVIQEDKDKN